MKELLNVEPKRLFYEKIRLTATFVAYLRSKTSIPFAKALADQRESQESNDLVGNRDNLRSRLIQFTPYFEARYIATDQIIKHRHMEQNIKIAAGLSPRGLAMTVDPTVTYVVTDLPQMLQQEMVIMDNIIARTGSPRQNLYFEAVNVLEHRDLVLAATHFMLHEPVTLVTGGLLTYFLIAKKRRLSRLIYMSF